MPEPKELFPELPQQVFERPREAGSPAPRLREAQRSQIELQLVELDRLVAEDHPARAVWAFVEKLDLSALLHAIKAREGVPGHPAADPKILMTLWLYATIEAVGSARQLARLCEDHIAYRWICGGVSMNHHTLGDFRVAHGELLDRLLTQGVTALVGEGLVSLTRLAQDGVRVRASAGASSFRRRGRLESLLAEAQDRVRQLRSELEGDGAVGTARQQRARERAARARVERTQAALEKMKELEAQRARREKTHKSETKKQKEPRASTTDPEVRRMKMADGGYRPAYNAQFVSDPQTQVIVAVGVDTAGSDGGQMGEMLDRLQGTYGQLPHEYLVDGGFVKNEDTEKAHAAGIEVFAPAPKNKHDTDPYAPRKGDGRGTAAWRKRMSSAEGKAIYRNRCKAECVNADWRNHGGQRFLVRGRKKVRIMLLWFAVAHNMMRALALRAASKVRVIAPASAAMAPSAATG